MQASLSPSKCSQALFQGYVHVSLLVVRDTVINLRITVALKYYICRYSVMVSIKQLRYYASCIFIQTMNVLWCALIGICTCIILYGDGMPLVLSTMN